MHNHHKSQSLFHAMLEVVIITLVVGALSYVVMEFQDHSPHGHHIAEERQ